MRRRKEIDSLSINRYRDYSSFCYLCNNLSDQSKEQLLTALLFGNTELILPDDDGTRRQFVEQLVMNDWFVRLFDQI